MAAQSLTYIRPTRQFAGLQVREEVPYAMSTTLYLGASISARQFPNADWLNTNAYPFAVEKLIPRVIAGTGTNGAADFVPLATGPDVNVLEAIVSVGLNFSGFNMPMTKDMNPIPLTNLIGGTTSERYWNLKNEIGELPVLPNSYGIVASATTTAFPAAVTYTQLRITLVLEGFNLIVAQPTG